MRNARLDKLQSRIKIGRRNNNLRYINDTTLMAENEEKLKSFLMKVKEESEKAGLKFTIQKMKIMASGPVISWQIGGEAMETMQIRGNWSILKVTVSSDRFYYFGLQNHCG